VHLALSTQIALIPGSNNFGIHGLLQKAVGGQQ